MMVPTLVQLCLAHFGALCEVDKGYMISLWQDKNNKKRKWWKIECKEYPYLWGICRSEHMHIWENLGLNHRDSSHCWFIDIKGLKVYDGAYPPPALSAAFL